MFGRVRQLLRENDAMREVLNFYAAPSNWRRRAKHSKGMPKRWDKSVIAYDRGGRAMAVILRIEAERTSMFWLRRLTGLFARRRPAPLVFHVPADQAPSLQPEILSLEGDASCQLDSLPICSTESSTTPAPDAERFGTTADSADTPGATV